ncbi:PAS domain S-box protein, partial [candidate division KSB1 bacterium]|nr:PAS domain S-box protein [candidate division KSB1 bacterium]
MQSYALAYSGNGIPVTYRNPQLKPLTFENGVPQGMVRAIYQDRAGLMWFGARAGIESEPHFYQTGWLAVLGSLVLAVMVYGGIRRRLHKLEATKRALEKEVADRTHQLRESEESVRRLTEHLEQRVLERIAALQDDEERYRVLYDHNPSMLFTVDVEGKVLSVNRSSREELGYAAAELLGRSVLEVFHEEDRGMMQQQLATCLKNPHRSRAWELRKLRKDGSIMWVSESARAIKNREGGWVILLVCTDITLRKQAESAIKESQNRYHVLFEEGPTPLWEIDMSKVKSLLAQWRQAGVTNFRAFFDEHPEALLQCLELVKTLDINQATWRLYGADSKEHLRQNARRILNAELLRMFKEQLVAVIAGRTDGEIETNTQTLAGKNLDVRVHWRIVPGHEHNLSRLFVALIDFTEKKETLDELQASQARFRALSAHLQSSREQERLAIARDLHDELGQTLTSLKMDLSMLERKARSASAKHGCDAVMGDIEAMQKRIAGTIQFVRSLITELRPEVLDTLGLLPALEWQIIEFHKRTGLAYEFHVEAEELRLAKDHTIAIFRIFQESLTNIARHANASKVKATIARRNGTLWVEVADDG